MKGGLLSAGEWLAMAGSPMAALQIRVIDHLLVPVSRSWLLARRIHHRTGDGYMEQINALLDARNKFMSLRDARAKA